MATYFICLFFCYFFFFTNAADPIPKSGKFYKAPSIIEKAASNYLVRGMRTFWFEHGTKLITHMTHEVYIDADAKYTQALYIKRKYEHAITFQLGSTAASIMDDFEDMLITYRRYANLSTFKTARQHILKYDLKSFNEALLFIEGLYYMIRVEEHVFNNAAERLQIKNAKVRRLREKRASTLLRSKNNQRNTLRTRDNQQNILQNRDNQQYNDRGLKDNSFGPKSPEQSSKIFDATDGTRQNIARSRSSKKPLWVYKEPKDDNNY